ncbi:MAG: hypothetical protein GEV03_01085 [Streptosporangiales bacterium]|nr:hypothetical protein [Streptosporangiales bacterium]
MSGRRRRHEPGPLRPGIAKDLVRRLLSRPQELQWDWLSGEGREAVPFPAPVAQQAGAVLMDARMAERMVLAALRLGVDHLLACRTQPEYLNEPVVVLPQNPPALAQQAARYGLTDFLVVPPGFTAALLVTTLGYGVAAGSPSFVEAALGADVDEAKRSFAEYAWGARDVGPTLVEAAYAFGCVASGPHHAPRWKAWSGASEVPPGSGVGEQLSLMRQLAGGSIGADQFVPAWLAARDREIGDGEHAVGPLADALRRVLYAVDDFVSAPVLRGPEDLNEAGLVEAIRAGLRILMPAQS